MIQMRLSEAADLIGARRIGADARFSGCGIDSRRIEAGQMFAAFPGQRHDGHDFLGMAAERGASCALLQRLPDDLPLPALQVGDVQRSLGDLARAWRRDFDLPLIAVTGSNGKTTVKEMLRAILSRQGDVLATEGNLNNELGVPLTLFRLDRAHRYAVIEMGASAKGDIGYLVGIALPDVALITQCAPAHLLGFGSVEGVARAKAEIYSRLGDSRLGGVAVINADDPWADHWRTCVSSARRLEFSMRRELDVYADRIELDPGSHCASFDLHAGGRCVSLKLPLPGRHNVMNALAAAACVHALGWDAESIAAGLERCRPVSGRMLFLSGKSGARLVDDSYNANPASLEAAIETLAGADRLWLVLGDMHELGAESAALHGQGGRMARARGVERIFALGEQSCAAVAAFGDGAEHFGAIGDLLADLEPQLDSGITLLVKGSRAMRMERVIERLVAEPQGEG